MNTLLELQDLSCVRGDRQLFSGLGARLAPSQWLRVQGNNGAGKTSLLRMICGLLLPARGAVLWRGEPVARLREEFSRELLYLGHAAALKNDLSAIENLQTAGALGGRTPGPDEAAEALQAAGLGAQLDLPARVLSQGQRRRVALARLALPEPAALWVLDEPFNALDAGACAWLTGLLNRHLKRGGLAVLTSHQSVALDASLPPLVLAL